MKHQTSDQPSDESRTPAAGEADRSAEAAERDGADRPCPSSWTLERHLLGELSAASATAEHLSGCPDCRARLAAMKRAGADYLASPEAQELRRRLAEQPVTPPLASVRRRRFSQAWAIAGLGAAAAGALVWVLSRAAPNHEAEVQAVLRFEREWMAAVRDRDPAALDRILADGYVYTDSRGRVGTKADDLRAARSGAVRLSLYEAPEMKVQLYGDTAVVTGRARLKGVGAGGQPFDTQVQFTDTLARIDGRWRAVAAHVSRPTSAPP